jgi:hypothetical protein
MGDNIKMNLKKGDEFGLDSTGSRSGSVLGFYENGNEPSDLVKGGELLDKMINSVAWV